MGKPRIEAILGPTNTGKTHYAIERMLAYPNGVIGLPLRLLAREVYDRIVALQGPSKVALVTGEERIIPPHTQWWVCTTEAMPENIGVDFIAIDEIQLAADPDRGHVFTDRLLHARGLKETLFLGAETMRKVIRSLVPEAIQTSRPRLSQLSYAGPKKLSRMQARSAIVGFSVDSVYAMAELIRRQKGGAAVVMGALSPRTRNAQVSMYQNGDVDYLVATDAIGMGLNLDINHVAFSSLSKFDGRRIRALAPNELGQIAGRAGRHLKDGSFGVTGEAEPLDAEIAQAIEESRFRPLDRLMWRNSNLEFSSPQRLIQSLEVPSSNEFLIRGREGDDLAALKELAEDPDIMDRAIGKNAIKLLWQVCSIPDFRSISLSEHARLLGQIFVFLHNDGEISRDWLQGRIARINRTDGDIDALAKRLAFIRTWTYVAERPGWLADGAYWREETRALEDRLSDALHQALMKRFVDRRTSVLLKKLKQREKIVAEVSADGDVSIDGALIGRLEGFRFRQDDAANPDEAKTLRAASVAALTPHYHLLADRCYNAPDTEFELTEQGGLIWGTNAIGRLSRGEEMLKPSIKLFVDEEAGAEIAAKVERRLGHFLERRIATLFEPLMNLSKDESLAGLSKGFAYRLVENLGIIPRENVFEEVRSLEQSDRSALRKHGVRFGQYTIFLPLLLKPAPTRLRLVLWSLWNNLDHFAEAPPPGLVTLPQGETTPEIASVSGYRVAGERMIRIDMLERLADQIRNEDARAGFEAKTEMLSITGLSLLQFVDLLQGLGYKSETFERPKQRPVPTENEAKTADIADNNEPSEESSNPEEKAEPEQLPEAEAAMPESIDTPSETSSDEAILEVKPEENEPPEMEQAFIFRWAGNQRQRRHSNGAENNRNGERRGGRKPPPSRGNHSKAGKPSKNAKARSNSAKPGAHKNARNKPPREKAIDPNNPFAMALSGLKLDD